MSAARDDQNDNFHPDGEEETPQARQPKDKSTLLATRRVACKSSVSRVLLKLHQVLQEQRDHTEELQPWLRIGDPVEPHEDIMTSKLLAEKALQDANDAMEVRLRDLVLAIETVRRATSAVDPTALVKPAVVALSVSAPSTSWALDTWIYAPMPQLSRAVTSVFKAAYSQPETEENANRLKRRWGDDKLKRKKTKIQRQQQNGVHHNGSS